MNNSKTSIVNNSTAKIANLSVRTTIFFVITHIQTLIAVVRYLWIVAFDFFLLQFMVKWGWRKVEIINVDHELDEKVPFVPELAPIYLDFIHFWVRPLGLLIRKNRKKALGYVVEFLHTISDIYGQAATFYKYKMTTTKRPTAEEYRDKNFDGIRRVDPHYLCVPSLHIAVVVFTYAYFKDVFEKGDFSEEEKQQYNNELFNGAIEIGETVLYVKQHSVNCIPAALYMMTDAIAGLFSIEDAIVFIDALFAEQTNITKAAKKEINIHLHHLFEQLLLEGKYEDHWLEPLKRWLFKYTTGVYEGQSL